MYEINLLLNYAMKFFTLLLHRVSSNLRGVLGFVQESYRNFSKIHVYIFYRHFTVIVLEKINQKLGGDYLHNSLDYARAMFIVICRQISILTDLKISDKEIK